MKLSILIPTIERHKKKLEALEDQLNRQIKPYEGQACYMVDRSEVLSVGAKRNYLLDACETDYIAFIDSDDRIADNYIELLMQGIATGADCCSLKGIITTNGKSPALFEHSLKYPAYKTNERADYAKGEIRYERFPNHLNCIRRELAWRIRFPEISYGEDTEWATLLHKTGLIKTEHYIDQVIYYYDYETNKS